MKQISWVEEVQILLAYLIFIVIGENVFTTAGTL